MAKVQLFGYPLVMLFQIAILNSKSPFQILDRTPCNDITLYNTLLHCWCWQAV